MKTRFGVITPQWVLMDELESVLEVGINEIILQYPNNQEDLPLFERVATEVLPKLRA